MSNAGVTGDSWFSPGKFALLTACLVAACFPSVLTGSDSFFFRDYAIFSYPLAAYHKACFWQGELPLWNPYNSCGLPFLAQWNTMVLYPFSAIYLFFPLPWSLNIFCLFHLWLGGLGMYFMARSWTHHPPAAALAGVAFLFNGVVLSCLKWPNNIAALGWMPWVVLTCESAFRGNLRLICIAALTGAIQMLTGAPEIIILTWMIVGSLWVFHAFTSERRMWSVAALPTIGLLVTGLCAVQLLPFLDLLGHSQRDSSFRGSQWPMPPWGWANMVLPLFRMISSYHGVYAQPGQYWISTYYVSIAILLLAVVALWRVRSGRVRLLGALLLFSMWMALGDRAFLYQWLRAAVPGLGMMRFPVKFIVLAAFALPLLGAMGLQQLLARPPRQARLVVLIPGVTLILIVSSLVLQNELDPYRLSEPFVTTWNGLWRMGFLATAMAVLLRYDQLSGKLAGPLLLAVVVADGLTHTAWLNPVAPSWVYKDSVVKMEPLPKLGESRAMISPEASDRVDHLKLNDPSEDVMASRLALYCNLNLLENIPKVDGFYAIYPREMAKLQDTLYGTTDVPSPGVLDFMGVSRLTVLHGWKDWQYRTSALPLITAPASARASGNPLGDVLSPRFDPRHEVLLTSTNAISGSASIKSIAWKSQQLQFKCHSPTGSVVVISQTFYHPWKARVDGQPATISLANAAFQSLVVPAGTHEIELVYEDRAFRWGAMISTATAALLILLLITSRSRRFSTGTPAAQALP